MTHLELLRLTQHFAELTERITRSSEMKALMAMVEAGQPRLPAVPQSAPRAEQLQEVSQNETVH